MNALLGSGLLGVAATCGVVAVAAPKILSRRGGVAAANGVSLSAAATSTPGAVRRSLSDYKLVLDDTPHVPVIEVQQSVAVVSQVATEEAVLLGLVAEGESAFGVVITEQEVVAPLATFHGAGTDDALNGLDASAAVAHADIPKPHHVDVIESVPLGEHSVVEDHSVADDEARVSTIAKIRSGMSRLFARKAAPTIRNVDPLPAAEPQEAVGSDTSVFAWFRPAAATGSSEVVAEPVALGSAIEDVAACDDVALGLIERASASAEVVSAPAQPAPADASPLRLEEESDRPIVVSVDDLAGDEIVTVAGTSRGARHAPVIGRLSALFRRRKLREATVVDAEVAHDLQPSVGTVDDVMPTLASQPRARGIMRWLRRAPRVAEPTLVDRLSDDTDAYGVAPGVSIAMPEWAAAAFADDADLISEPGRHDDDDGFGITNRAVIGPETVQVSAAPLADEPEPFVSAPLTIDAASVADVVPAESVDTHVLVERDRSGAVVAAAAFGVRVERSLDVIAEQLRSSNVWMVEHQPEPTAEIDAAAIAAADARLNSHEPIFEPKPLPMSMAPAWASEFAEAGVDVSVEGRIVLLDSYGAAPDDMLSEWLERVVMTDDAAAVQVAALLLAAERRLPALRSHVDLAMESTDLGVCLAAANFLTAIGDENGLIVALEHDGIEVVRAASVGLIEVLGADEARARIERAAPRHREEAVALTHF